MSDNDFAEASGQRMRAILYIIFALAWLQFGEASAQRPSGPVVVQRHWTEVVENSELEQALGHFEQMFWSANPAVGLPEANSAARALSLDRAMQESLQSLTALAHEGCRRLSARQRAFLRSVAEARFATVRSAAAARADGSMRDRILSTQLEFQDDCAPIASSSSNVIRLDDGYVLSVTLVALYQIAQIHAAPARVEEMMGEDRARFGASPWDEREGAALLSRVESTRIWRNALRSFRGQLGGELALARYVPLAVFERLLTAGAGGDCSDSRVECHLQVKLGLSLTSTLKYQIYFNEQLDFLLAHELAHRALDHDPRRETAASQARGEAACAALVRLEHAADEFGAKLLPSFSSENVTAGSAAFRAAFAQSQAQSGVQLFLVDTMDLLGSDGGDCTHPSSQVRLARLGVRPQSLPDYSSIVGVWEGNYSCGVGPAGIRLNLLENNGELLADVDFYPLPSNPGIAAGALRMRGIYDPDAQTLALTEQEWIRRPQGYVMPDIHGVFTGAGGFQGQVIAPNCAEIVLSRGIPATPPVSSRRAAAVIYGEWTGTYYCGQGPTGARLRIGGVDGNVSARFDFFPTSGGQSVPSGSFEMTGVYQNGILTLRGSRWLSRPPGWGMLDLVGTFDFSAETFDGVVNTRGCSRFHMSRSRSGR